MKTLREQLKDINKVLQDNLESENTKLISSYGLDFGNFSVWFDGNQARINYTKDYILKISKKRVDGYFSYKYLKESKMIVSKVSIIDGFERYLDMTSEEISDEAKQQEKAKKKVKKEKSKKNFIELQAMMKEKNINVEELITLYNRYEKLSYAQVEGLKNENI